MTRSENLEDARKRRVFKKFTYRGVDLETLIDMPLSEFKELLPSRLRRHINRGFTQEEVDLLMKCREVRAVKRGVDEVPEQIDTHLRTMPILPDMIGVTIGVYNGMGYVPVEVKPEMLGLRLRDFAPTKVTCTHGKPGVGATSSSKFVPLK